MSDSEMLRRIRAIMSTCDLTVTAAAGIVGVSPHTLRFTLATGIMPVKESPRRAIHEFVERNVAARTRSDLRLG